MRFPGFEGEYYNLQLIDIVNDKSNIIAGPFGSNLKVKDYKEDGIPLIRLQNVERNKFIKKDIKFVSEEKAKELKQHSFKPNDIVFSKLGNPIGKTCKVPEDFGPGIVVADVVRIRPSKEHNVDYITFLLNTNLIKKQINIDTIGSTRKRVNLDQVRHLKINIPSIEEQNKIASFLSKLDKKIELMEKKYNKYEYYKKFLVKNLLCNNDENKPVISFNNENWNIYSLNNLFDSIKGKELSKDDINSEGKNKALLYGDLYTTYNEIIHNVVNFTDNEEGVLSKKYDIIMPMSTTTNGIDLATASLLLENNVHIGGDTLILRKKVDYISEYYLTYLLSNALTKEISRLTQGTTIVHQYWRYLKKIKIKIPDLNSQKKIVNLLINIDNEKKHIQKEIELNKEFKRSLLSKMFC